MFGFFRRRKREDGEYYRMLKEIFGIKPNNVELYKLALIHRSASRFLRRGVPVNNERLEFLGDAVIEIVVSDYLFTAFPHEDEGFLTKMRSRMVNRATLNELCKDIGLAKYIRNNSGGGGIQRNMNGDAFEAIIGAIYLDKGYEFANRALIKVLERHITLEEIRTTETDFKSRLIEWCQKGRHHLRFSTSYGPDGSHNAPQFKSVAIIDGFEVGYGLGSSKKEAEQRAAYTVSQALRDDMGDMILEMVDKSLGETSSVAAKPKRRRKRGGVKHRKVTSSAAEEQAAAQSPDNNTEETKPEQSASEIDKQNQVVETTVAEGVVSVSVVTVVDSKTDTPAKRRGRPGKTKPESEKTANKTVGKAVSESKSEPFVKPDTTAKKKPEEKNLAEKKPVVKKPVAAKPKTQAKSKAHVEQEVQTKSKTVSEEKATRSESKSNTPEPVNELKRRGRPRKPKPEGEETAKKPVVEKPKAKKPAEKKPVAAKPEAQAKSDK